MPTIKSNAEGRSPRLKGWKEIAGALGVSVRTAQAWERSKGLPIYRQNQGFRRRVEAFADDLEKWKDRNQEPVSVRCHFPGFFWGMILLCLVEGIFAVLGWTLLLMAN